MNQTKRRSLLICLLALAIASMTVATAVWAKYVSETKRDGLLGAEPFAFICSCDDGKTYYTEKDTFTFTVANHSGFEVSYHVSADGVSLGDDSLGIGYEDAVTVAVDEDTPIVVQATAPYEKTYSFTVKKVASVTNQYKIKDNGNWIQLDIYIGATPPDTLTVHYGALSPDTLNGFMTGWPQTSDASADMSALVPYSQYTLIFFENVAESKGVYTDIPMTAIPASEITIAMGG